MNAPHDPSKLPTEPLYRRKYDPRHIAKDDLQDDAIREDEIWNSALATGVAELRHLGYGEPAIRALRGLMRRVDK